MSSKKAKEGSLVSVDLPKEIQMPPYRFQREFEGFGSLSFDEKDNKIDEDKARKLKESLRNPATT